MSNSHSVLAQDLTRRALANVMPRMTFDKRKSGSAANILVAELSQMVEANLGDATTERVEEPRLQSFVHYLIGLKVRDDVLRRALLEQVANSGLQTVSEAARLVVQDAKDLLAAEVSPSVLEESKKWHWTYHNFRYRTGQDCEFGSDCNWIRIRNYCICFGTKCGKNARTDK